MVLLLTLVPNDVLWCSSWQRCDISSLSQLWRVWLCTQVIGGGPSSLDPTWSSFYGLSGEEFGIFLPCSEASSKSLKRIPLHSKSSHSVQSDRRVFKPLLHIQPQKDCWNNTVICNYKTARNYTLLKEEVQGTSDFMVSLQMLWSALVSPLWTYGRAQGIKLLFDLNLFTYIPRWLCDHGRHVKLSVTHPVSHLLISVRAMKSCFNTIYLPNRARQRTARYTRKTISSGAERLSLTRVGKCIPQPISTIAD